MDEPPVEPVFKGANRPPMVLGIPIVPLFCLVAGCAFAASLVSELNHKLIAYGAMLPLGIVLREVSKNDPQRFRQYGLWVKMRIINFNRTGLFWRSSSYQALPVRRMKDRR